MIESTTAYSDLQFLFLAARDGWGKGAIVEIGSYKGKSAAALGLGSKCAGREKVFGVDPHAEGTKEIFLENMVKMGVADYVVPLVATSKEAAKTFDSRIRLLFIDGDHKYESVRNDILLWKDQVIPGGIIAFHDYYWPPVSRAIDELIRSSDEFTVEGAVGCALLVSKGERKNAKLFAEVNIFNKVKKAIRPWKKDTDGMLVNKYAGVVGRIKGRLKEMFPAIYERYIKQLSLKAIDRKRAPIIQAAIEKMAATSPFPIFENVEIETINRCNNNCAFCPVNKNDDTRPFKLMDYELFASIIKQLQDLKYSGNLGLFSNNEPLLDNRIIEFSKLARESLPNARLVILTNGILLTVEKLNLLMRYIDQLEISNYDDKLRFIPSVREIYDYCLKNRLYQGKVRVWLRKKNEILMNMAGQAKNRTKIPRLRSSCGYPFGQLVIRPDGKVSLCCNDARGQMTMGDLTKEKIIDVWNGPVFRDTREKLLKGRSHLSLCSLCDGCL